MEDFITPPEAPVFHPSADEFKDPIAYLTKIRPVVVNTGICKIRPPPGWKPPFSLDVENFSFTPRLQPLNELEAKTRVKLNFLESLAKFWELQGVSFKIPNVDRSPMDLHTIFKAVTGFGGFKEMTRQRKWTQLARELGYEGVSVAGSIRQNYERYLYPYEIFLAKRGNLTLKASATPTPSPQKTTTTTTTTPTTTPTTPTTTPPPSNTPQSAPTPTSSSSSPSSPPTSSSVSQPQHQPPPSSAAASTPTTPTTKVCKYGLRQNKRRQSAKEDPDYSVEIEADHPEFKKLAFTSPGPKNAFAPLQRSGYGRPPHMAGGCVARGGERREEATEAASTTAAETTEVKQEQPVSTTDSSFTVPVAPLSSSAVTSSAMTSSIMASSAMTSSAMTSSIMTSLPMTSSPSSSSLVSSVTVSSEGIQMNQPSMLQQHDSKSQVPVEEVKCEECGSGECDDELLLCDGCDASYHTFCLDPPLPSIPPGDWRCPTCVAQACTEDTEAFGFEQSKKSYSLESFGEKANQFKSFYFRQHPSEVPYSTVEREFWRLVSSIEEDVTVEYGADLHTSQHGSGFPTTQRHRARHHARREGEEQAEEEEEEEEEEDYLVSGWNLNNIPNLQGSILRYISADISGMKVPWLYIGMCFSCFCWHIEDHWSYSINYLHWGEPKTWYGVPPAYAENLEATMKEQAPELFENHPDLMHHLATILSPAVLMKHGIPVVRTDQCEGEFIVTFPRAYHAGFNQGFNCAEAVNFLLGDWLPVGRQSIEHYRSLSRTPVFSHDELLCKMVAQPEKLELCLLPTSSEDMATMTGLEERLRQGLQQKGIVQEQREVFELASDENRLCSVCSTYCFLSAIRCPCNPKKLVCGYHSAGLCECPPSKKVLRYRYTTDELYGMLRGIQNRSQTFRDWCRQVDLILDCVGEDKADLDHLKMLLEEGTDKHFTLCTTYDELRDTIKDVEESASVAVQLTSRGKGEGKVGGEKMNIDSLKEFLRQVETLPCRVPEAKLLEDHLSEVEAFQREAQEELQSVAQQAEQQKTVPTSHLAELLARGEEFRVHIPELELLRVAVQQSKWVVETEARLRLEVLTVESLKRLLKQAGAMQRSRVVELVSGRVRELLTAAQDWEGEAKAALKQKPPHPVAYLEGLLAKARRIKVHLPSQSLVVDTLERAAQWKKQAQQLQDNDHHPHYDHLKGLLATGRPIAVKLDLLAQLESRHAAAKGWVDRAGRTVIKKNSLATLLEVLLPRTKSMFFQRFSKAAGGKKKTDIGGGLTAGELEVGKSPLSELGGDRMKEMEKIHSMEQEEVLWMKQLRNENIEKMERDETRKATGHPPVLYCFCRKPESGYMLQCELCNEWYHAACLHIPKGKRAPGRDIGKDSRFLCAVCLRTRRPRLDAIVSLLISLQKVPVAISEGTALHCLAERAISWQKKARQEITYCNTVLEAAKQQMRRVEEVKAHIGKWRAEMQLTAEEREKPTSIEAQLASSAGSVLAHYDSELQRLRSDYAGLSGCKRGALDHLLMEGDLLEVTMDEVQQLWQLLQLDTEYLSVFEASPAKVGHLATQSGAQLEERQQRRRKRSVASPSSSDGSITPTSKRRRTPASSAGSPATITNTTTTTATATTTTRSGSVKRETTPVSRSTVTITHSQQQQQQHQQQHHQVGRSAKPGAGGAGGGKKRQLLRRRRESAVNQDLGCNEEIVLEEEEEEDDEEEDEGECSATQCLQPVADQIIWVQCDHCHEWFHCVCVGLTKEYAEQIDTYKCAMCKQAATTTKNSAAPLAAAAAAGTISPSVPPPPPPRPSYSVKVSSLPSPFSPSPGQT